MKKHLFVVALVCASLGIVPAFAGPEPFEQEDLVSDMPNQAAHRDTDLKNPWGLVVTRDGMFHVANEGTGVLTTYNDAGVNGVENVDVDQDGDSHPTGLVLNAFRSAFRIHEGNHSADAMLITVGVDGSITGFNPDLDRNDSFEAVQRNNAAYTGAAIA